MKIDSLKAKKAEHEAKRAEKDASMSKAIAGRIKLQIEACIHKIKVVTDIIKELSKKADNEPEALAKHIQAEALAADIKRRAVDKKTEVSTEGKHLRRLASDKQAEAKVAKTAHEKDAAKSAAKDAETKALNIEVEAKELELLVRKAASDVKKTKLEVEEAKEAIVLRTKHFKVLAEAEAEMQFKKIEFECRKAEANARTAQAEAKKAEAKAIMAGDNPKAEAQKLEANIYKAEAIAKDNEVREMKAAAKSKAKTPLKKPQPIVEQIPKGQARYIEKKHLSAKGLLDTVYKTFQEISDQNLSEQNNSKITLCDCLMSGLAVFGLKYPSLLQFDHDSQEGGCIHHNLKTLYKVNQVPSDTYMRERLDGVDPIYLRPAFKKIFAEFQRGKGLEKYVFLEDYYLASGDGTGLFSSKTINCQNCCTKHHKDGSNTYYHQMMSAVIVHPEHEGVIPLCPEPITNEDGSDKNDCERNASERLYRHIRREHPHLPLIITEDALGSNGPHIRLFKELNMRFILVVKQDGNKSLFDFMKGLTREEHIHTDDEYNYKIQYINNVPLNDAHDDLMVNFFEIWVYDKYGNEQYHNSWITDILITISNAYRLCQGGRAKWKIENETFNTLKNQGYHFEHNFGHGFKHLSTVFAFLMFMAFLIDQIQQISCGLFQSARVKMKSKIRLWGRMRAYFTTLSIGSWEKLWQAIDLGLQGQELVLFFNSS